MEAGSAMRRDLEHDAFRRRGVLRRPLPPVAVSR